MDDVKPLTMNHGAVKQQQQQQQQEDTKPNPADMGGTGGGQAQQHATSNNTHHQHQQLQVNSKSTRLCPLPASKLLKYEHCCYKNISSFCFSNPGCTTTPAATQWW